LANSPFKAGPKAEPKPPSPVEEQNIPPIIKVAPVKPKPSEAQLKLEEKVRSEILSPESFGSFDEFPYYLDPALKRHLINSAYIFLDKPEYEAYTKEIPTLSRRILLSGEPGMVAVCLINMLEVLKYSKKR
jgi:hypothetical protein